MVRTMVMALALMGCGGAPQGSAGAGGAALNVANPLETGPVIAKVNDGAVGVGAFGDAAARRAMGQNLDDAGRRAVLDSLIEEELVFQEGLKLGLYHDAKVRKALVNTVLREEVYRKTEVTDFPDADMRAYFEKHKEEFVVPEKMQVKRIFLTVDEGRPEAARLAEAQRYRKEISANPEKFKDLALQYSEDAYKRRGGDLGYVTREGKTGVDAAVIAKAFALKPGELSEPFVAGGGVNLLLAVSHRERVERTFEQMKGPVIRKMKNERHEDLLKSYLANLRNSATVAIDDAALAAAPVHARPAAPLDEPEVPGLSDDVGGHGPGEP